jgi:hypothetical protein
MVVVKEQHQQEADWDGNGNPLPLKIPEVNRPASRLSWVEGFCDRNSFNIGLRDVSGNM